MRERVTFESWGGWLTGRELPAYAMRDVDGETRGGAVARCIAASQGVHVITCCSQGTSLDGRGHPEAQHYQATVGRPSPGGGYDVDGEVWFAVPIEVR